MKLKWKSEEKKADSDHHEFTLQSSSKQESEVSFAVAPKIIKHNEEMINRPKMKTYIGRLKLYQQSNKMLKNELDLSTIIPRLRKSYDATRLLLEEHQFMVLENSQKYVINSE